METDDTSCDEPTHGINTTSDLFWTLHNPAEETPLRIRGAICKAYREVKDPMDPNKWITITDHLDSCGAFDLVQRQYLHDIKQAAQYGMHPIRMELPRIHNRLVTEKADILHHAQASLEGKPLMLKRSIQASDSLRGYFSKISDLMHRNLLSWYDDDLVIARDMVEHPAELGNDQGRSGLCACTYYNALP